MLEIIIAIYLLLGLILGLFSLEKMDDILINNPDKFDIIVNHLTLSRILFVFIVMISWLGFYIHDLISKIFK